MIEFILSEHDNEAKEYKHIDENHVITDAGNIFYFKSRQWHKGRPRKHTNGYLRASINNKDAYMHRLVALAFIENPHQYKEINHKDGNKTNNKKSNLEWCNRSQNSKHAFETGLRHYEELRVMAKKPRLKRRRLTAEQAKEIRESTESDRLLAKRYEISRGLIYQIKKGLTYKEI